MLDINFWDVNAVFGFPFKHTLKLSAGSAEI
jgi:hypothetical protein